MIMQLSFKIILQEICSFDLKNILHDWEFIHIYDDVYVFTHIPISLSNSSHISLTHSPPNFMPPHFFFFLIIHFAGWCCPYVQGCRAMHWIMRILSVAICSKGMILLPRNYQLTIAGMEVTTTVSSLCDSYVLCKRQHFTEESSSCSSWV